MKPTIKMIKEQLQNGKQLKDFFHILKFLHHIVN